MATESQKNNSYKTLANIAFWWGVVLTPIIILGLFADPAPEGVTALIIFGLVPLLGGYFFKKRLTKKIEDQYERSTLRSLMLLAKQQKGRVTASEVSLHLDLDYEEAKKVLEVVVTKGIAMPEADDDGTIVYYFRELD
ncbi:MAG: hypothetical protein ACLFR2_07390 [Candidatus Kapaibacterium sp.]